MRSVLGSAVRTVNGRRSARFARASLVFATGEVCGFGLHRVPWITLNEGQASRCSSAVLRSASTLPCRAEACGVVVDAV